MQPSSKRFIVVGSIFEEFERRFVTAVKKLRVGDPMDRSTDIGPLAREDLRDTVCALLDDHGRSGNFNLFRQIFTITVPHFGPMFEPT